MEYGLGDIAGYQLEMYATKGRPSLPRVLFSTLVADLDPQGESQLSPRGLWTGRNTFDEMVLRGEARFIPSTEVDKPELLFREWFHSEMRLMKECGERKGKRFGR